MARFYNDPNASLWKSTVTAAKGFVYAVRTEKKVRQVVIAVAGAVVFCAAADVGYFQILMIIFSWVLALICEMFNTALEKALDYASGKEYHILIRQGKDYAAACTFVALVFAGSLTLFVLYEKLSAERAERADKVVSRETRILGP